MRYIKFALTSEENDVPRLACGLISDLCHLMQEDIGNYHDDYVPILHDILTNSD